MVFAAPYRKEESTASHKEAHEELNKDILNDIKNMSPTFKEMIRETFIGSADELKLGGVSINDWEKTGWALPIVFFYYAVFAMSFFYFIYSLTLTGMAATYLSILPSDSNQFCIEIPLTISTIVQGDAFGNWDTNSSFSQNTSIYTLEFKGSKVTNDQYRNVMYRFKDKLMKLSEKASNRDAAWNAMMWSTFQFSDKLGNMDFYSSADPRYLYRGDVRSGFVSSASGSVCNQVRQYGKLDNAGGQIVFSVPTYRVSDETLSGYAGGYNSTDGAVNNYQGQNGEIYGYDIKDSCPDQYPSTLWDSFSQSPYTGNLEVGFDLRTVACAMSVNMGVTKLSAYTQTSSIYGTIASGGLPGFFYYDHFYDSMNPFFCVDKQTTHDMGIYTFTNAQINGPDLCFVIHQTYLYGSNYDTQAPLLFYPMAESLSENLDIRGIFHCECPRDKLDPNCNQKNIVMGLFYDKDITTTHYDNVTSVVTSNIPTNQIKFALILQKYLIDDPITGDLKMQQHFLDFFKTSLLITDNYGRFNLRNQQADASLSGKIGLHANATYDEVHLATWKTICPWGTCGSFVFQITSDQSVDAFLAMNNNNYQAGLAPFLNDTFNVTKIIAAKNSVPFFYNYTAESYNTSYYMSRPQCDKRNYTTQTCQTVTPVFYNTLLKRQMCENTIYNSAVMDSFINTSPVAVVQPYYQCRNTAKAALVNSVGNAAGTAGIVSGIFMLIAGIFFRKLHNRRALAQAKKMALEERENGGEESLLRHKVALLTSREARQVDDSIDKKTMTAMFDTIKCLVDTMTDEKRRVDGKDRSGRYFPPASGKEDSSFIDLQSKFKKLTDIVDFDFNSSHLTNISKSTKGNNEEESKHGPYI